jgi:drug/metabolite transporter (DMT)-like permease
MNILVWVILCLLWGTTWIFIKIGLTDLRRSRSPAGAVHSRDLILLPLIRLRRFPWPSSSAEWKLIALTGFLQFSLNYSSVFWAEQHITSVSPQYCSR